MITVCRATKWTGRHTGQFPLGLPLFSERNHSINRLVCSSLKKDQSNLCFHPFLVYLLLNPTQCVGCQYSFLLSPDRKKERKEEREEQEQKVKCHVATDDQYFTENIKILLKILQKILFSKFYPHSAYIFSL